MAITDITPRKSKYCNAGLRILKELGHATNAELHQAVQVEYPLVSLTTIHRVTSRLAARGEIGVAPSDAKGTLRYDKSNAPHDHFMCTKCSRLQDIAIAEKIRGLLRVELPECCPSGQITVCGICKMCR